MGPIACRIVTCVPPWQWDGSCDMTPATDNSTGSHDRPCLHDGFTDIAPNAYYVESVAWAVEAGITSGYSGDIFGPHEPVLRWHMAAFLWRYEGKPEAAQASDFVDVQQNWYAPAVDWMVDAGITSGTDADRFGPDEPLTRSQVITFLWRLRGRPAPYLEAPFPFDDVDINAFDRDAIHWATQVGLSQGVGDREFGGDLAVDRAQAVTFLHRYDKFTSDPGNSGDQDSDRSSEVGEEVSA